MCANKIFPDQTTPRGWFYVKDVSKHVILVPETDLYLTVC